MSLMYVIYWLQFIIKLFYFYLAELYHLCSNRASDFIKLFFDRGTVRSELNIKTMRTD